MLFGREAEPNKRKCGYKMALVQSNSPTVDLLAKRIEINPTMPGGIGRQVPASPFQQRSAADAVPRRIMMKGDRDLDEALKKLAFRFRRRPPDILQDFVGFKEMGGVEKGYPLEERVSRDLLVAMRGRHFGELSFRPLGRLETAQI